MRIVPIPSGRNHSFRRAQYSRARPKRETYRYSLPAVRVIVVSVVAAPFEKVAEILGFRVRGSTQERLDMEDLLQRFQRGTVVVVNGIAVSLLTFALGKR